MSQINDTEIDAELQRVRDALRGEEKYAEVAQAIGRVEQDWSDTGCPYDARRRWELYVCRDLAPVAQRRRERRRGMSLEQFLRLVRALGRSPIDFDRFAGGNGVTA